MATGNVTPRRKKGRVAEKAAEWRYRHKSNKICPACGAAIDNTATICPEHVSWYKLGGQAREEKLRLVHAQFDRAMDAGVPVIEIVKVSGSWHDMEPDAIEAAAQKLIDSVG